MKIVKAAIVFLQDDGTTTTVIVQPERFTIDNEIREVPGLGPWRSIEPTGRQTVTLRGEVLAHRESTPLEAEVTKIIDVPALPAPKDE